MLDVLKRLFAGIVYVVKVSVMAILGLVFVPVYLWFHNHYRTLPKWLQGILLPILFILGRIVKPLLKALVNNKLL